MYKVNPLLVVLALALLFAIGCGSVSGNGASPTPTPTPVAGNPTPTLGNPSPTPTPAPSTSSTLVFVGSGISSGISEFKLNPDGTLTQVPTTAGIAFSGATALAQSGTSLIGAQVNESTGSEQITLYAIDGQTGALTVKATADFTAPALDAFGTLSAAMNDEFAYVGTQNGIYGFSVAGGNLTPVPGSPFQTGPPGDEFQLAAYSFLQIKGAFLMAAHGANSAFQALQIGANG